MLEYDLPSSEDNELQLICAVSKPRGGCVSPALLLCFGQFSLLGRRADSGHGLDAGRTEQDPRD